MLQEEFVNKILDILSSISNVSAIKDKRYIALYKDGVMFGKIISQSVLLLTKNNKFIEVENELITRLLRPKNKIEQSDLDVFLFEATKSWWLAKRKTITTKLTLYYFLSMVKTVILAVAAYSHLKVLTLSDKPSV